MFCGKDPVMKVFLMRWSGLLVLSLSLALLGTAPAGAQSLPDFTRLAKAHGPSVVNISITQVNRLQSRHGGVFPFDEDDPMFEFFRRFMPHLPNLPREFRTRSLGSGFIISDDGYILTNAHVVDKADEIIVRLTDKRELKAKVVGVDKRTDVALIKVKASGLPAVQIGDPSRLQVGEWVLAIGSPFGFHNTVTSGIVSAKGRSLPQENYVPFIQTDVAINPGNSGGPLFNMSGQVVGINSQIYSRSGGYQGISFAIPIDVAMDVSRQLQDKGHVRRGRIGVVIQEVSKELAENFGLPKPTGALINSVEPDGPAEHAGLKQGDVILAFNGKTVEKSADLPRYVATTPPGSRAKVTVWRNAKKLNIHVKVGEIQEELASTYGQQGEKSTEQATSSRLGLVLSNISAGQLRKLRLKNGVRVREVRRNQGIRTGDILISLIYKGVRNEIKNVAQFDRLLRKVKDGAKLTLLIRRGKIQSFVTVRVGKR